MLPAADIIATLPMVRRMARRYARTPLGYEDVLSAGCVALVEAARRYDAERGVPFAAYACRRVSWAMLDACTRYGSVRDAETPVPDRELDCRCITDDSCARELLEEVAALPPADRHVVLLHAAGYSGREIAEALGVHESRVSQRLARARRKLTQQ